MPQNTKKVSNGPSKRFGDFGKRREDLLDLTFFSNIGYSHGFTMKFFRSSKLAKERLKNWVSK